MSFSNDRDTDECRPAWRLWREAGLQVLRKRSRKRIACSWPRPRAPAGAGLVWTYDLVFGAYASGQQIKYLTVIDEFTRECLAIDVAGSIRSGRVIEVLLQLISVHGAPTILRSDNGPEFVSSALLRRAGNENLDMALIDPGKPWQNGTTESFNGKFRDECLSMEWFRNRLEAKVVIDQWRRHYNEIRPHSSLGNRTPAAFKQSLCSTTQPEPSSRNEWCEEFRQVTSAINLRPLASAGPTYCNSTVARTIRAAEWRVLGNYCRGEKSGSSGRCCRAKPDRLGRASDARQFLIKAVGLIARRLLLS